MVVDTPGFDHENTYSYDNFQAVEALLKRYVQWVTQLYIRKLNKDSIF